MCFLYFWRFWGRRLNPGRGWHPDLKSSRKGSWIWRFFGSKTAPFSYVLELYFLVFFWSVFFAALAASRASKVPERVPKGSPKSLKRLSKGTLWNMLKAWQAWYGRHMGRSRGGSRNHFFQECGAKASPYAPEEGSGRFFVILGDLWGSRMRQCCSFLAVFFRTSNTNENSMSFWGVGGRGLAPLILHIMQELWINFITPCTLKGGGEFTGCRLCRRPLLDSNIWGLHVSRIAASFCIEWYRFCLFELFNLIS